MPFKELAPPGRKERKRPRYTRTSPDAKLSVSSFEQKGTIYERYTLRFNHPAIDALEERGITLAHGMKFRLFLDAEERLLKLRADDAGRFTLVKNHHIFAINARELAQLSPTGADLELYSSRSREKTFTLRVR